MKLGVDVLLDAAARFRLGAPSQPARRQLTRRNSARCLGDANTDDNTNLPILLAGGGFKHGQHLAFNREDNTPLCNLFLTMLHQLGVEAEAFGSSTGAVWGLESI